MKTTEHTAGHHSTAMKPQKVTGRFSPSSVCRMDVLPLGHIGRFLLIQLKPKHHVMGETSMGKMTKGQNVHQSTQNT